MARRSDPWPGRAHRSRRPPGQEHQNRLPRPGSLSAASQPPCSSTMSLRDRQAQAGRFADRLGGEEGLEHARQHVGRHARPVVAHAARASRAPSPRVVRPRGQRCARSQRHVDAPPGAGLDRVHDQVGQRLLHLRAVRDDRGCVDRPGAEVQSPSASCVASGASSGDRVRPPACPDLLRPSAAGRRRA